VQRAEASLANARAGLAQARPTCCRRSRNYERQAEIRKTNPALVSEAELEQLETQYEVNQALVVAAEENVKQAEASSPTRAGSSRAPHLRADGRQGDPPERRSRRDRDHGHAQPRCRHADDDFRYVYLETKVKVDETDVSRIHVGDSAVVQIDAFPDTTFIGRVVEISNSSVRRAGDRHARTRRSTTR
jgi:HlyD family secretion protein